MLFAGVNVAGTKHNDKQRHRPADMKGGVLPEKNRAAAVGAQWLCDQLKSGGNGFELQCDVRHNTKHCDDGYQNGEGVITAVTGGNKVGNGGQAFFFGNADDFPQHAPEKKQKQNRADINTEEHPAAGGSHAYSTIKGPGGAINRQRQTVNHTGVVHRSAAVSPAVTVPGNTEQRANV